MRLQLPLVLSALALVAADAPSDAAKIDLEKMQGKWAVVTLENDGKALAAEAAKAYTFTVKGDRYTLKGGDDNYQGVLKLDPSKKPKALDASFVDADGKDKGKAQGIYDLDGDKLRIAWREKGDGRPTDFASKPGSGDRFIVLKREK